MYMLCDACMCYAPLNHLIQYTHKKKHTVCVHSSTTSHAVCILNMGNYIQAGALFVIFSEESCGNMDMHQEWLTCCLHFHKKYVCVCMYVCMHACVCADYT